MQYSSKVMEHFAHPRNVGEIKNPDGVGHVGNPVCGDIMELYIKVKDGIITDAKFKTFGCLPPEENIVSSAMWRNISSIRVGDRVLNSDGKATMVAETYREKYDGKVVLITPFVSPYNAFTVTDNHPVLCVKRENLRKSRRASEKCSWLRIDEKELLTQAPKFVKAKYLKESDYIIFTFNNKVKDNNFFSKEIMRLIGYYIAEGYITANDSVVNFALNKNEKEIIKEIKDLLLHVTGRSAKKRTRGNTTEVYVCSRKWVSFFVEVANKYAREKKISQQVMLLPFEKQREMLSTYIKGDGDTYKRRA